MLYTIGQMSHGNVSNSFAQTLCKYCQNRFLFTSHLAFLQKMCGNKHVQIKVHGQH